MRRVRYWIAIGMLTGWATVAVQAGLTGAVNNNSADPGDVYQISLGDQANGELVHLDRTHTFTGLPAEMLGLDYVLTANDDKAAATFSLDLTFDTRTKLYLSIDNRAGDNNTGTPPALGGGTMDWVLDQGWEQTSTTWAKGGDAANPYTVYTLVCLGSSHTLYENNAGNMYSVAAAPYTNTLVPYATIDIGPNGQRIETGAEGLTGQPAHNQSGSYGPTAVSGKTSDSFDFSITSVDWRDRGDSTSSDELVLIGEDFVKHNGGTFTLTLDGLRGGRYAATSYHIDPGFSQCPRVQVYVTDGISSNRLQSTQGDAGTLLALNSLTTAIVSNSAASFEFWSNGTDPVVLRYHGTPGRSNDTSDDETPINGLDLVLDLHSRAPLIEPFALIDIGPNGQRVVADGIGFPNAPNNGNNGVNYGPQNLIAANGVLFNLKIDNQNPAGTPVGGIDWRDRGNSTSPDTLAMLGEDFIKNNLGMIRVTLGGLPRGSYRVVSYHIDGQGLLQCEEVLVYVTDDAGTAVLQDLSGDADHTAQALNSLTDRGVQATASAFEIESNGSDDILLYFDGTGAADDEVPLNGLRIEGIDVPSYGTVFSIR